MKCTACGNTKAKDFKYDGKQKLPKKQSNGTVIWVTYELWTCTACGSTVCVGKDK